MIIYPTLIIALIPILLFIRIFRKTEHSCDNKESKPCVNNVLKSR